MILSEKLELAKRLGFENVFNSSSEDPIDVVGAQTEGQGAHVCVEAAGVPQTFLYALGSVRRDGNVVLLGNPIADVTLPASLISQLMRREVCILGTWNSDYSVSGNDDDWRTVLLAMASGKLDLSPLITHKVSLKNSTEILHRMKDKSEFYAKVLIHP